MFSYLSSYVRCELARSRLFGVVSSFVAGLQEIKKPKYPPSTLLDHFEAGSTWVRLFLLTGPLQSNPGTRKRGIRNKKVASAAGSRDDDERMRHRGRQEAEEEEESSSSSFSYCFFFFIFFIIIIVVIIIIISSSISIRMQCQELQKILLPGSSQCCSHFEHVALLRVHTFVSMRQDCHSLSMVELYRQRGIKQEIKGAPISS